MTRTEWLEARRTAIGSSDAPNLVGCGWGDPMSVYRSKVEPPDEREPESGPMARGIALEPQVAERYERVMGVAIVYPVRYEDGVVRLPVPPDNYSLTRHPDRPWQSASLDRRRADNGATISLKTVAGWSDEWGENGSADVPETYRVQSQHEMGVTRTTMLDLAALNVIDWSFRVYRLDFDAALFDWLTAVESDFWHTYVVPRVAPPAGWERQHRQPECVRQVLAGTRIDLGDDIAALLDRRAELKLIEERAAEESKRLTGQIDAAMGTHERATAGGWNLRRSFIKGGSVSYNRADYWKLSITGRKS